MGNAIIIPLLLFLTANSLLLDIVVFSAYRASREPVAIQLREKIQTDGDRSVLTDEQGESIDVLGETNTIGTSGHEYVVYFGSGTTQSDTWVDIPQSEMTVNGSRYPGLEQAYFEVFVRVTNGIGRAHVKLYNVTAKHDVWFSELSTEKDSATKLVAPITLDKGEQSYRLMAKSTVRSQVFIDNARIRILTK